MRFQQCKNGWLFLIAFFCGALLAIGPGAQAQPTTGRAVPLFTLKDLQGQSYEIAAMKDQPLIILYFFDVTSRPSQEGLLHLDQLKKTQKEMDLIVWGITRSDASKVKGFISQTGLSFPVLIDQGNVSEAYAARLVLPTVCIVGPELNLLDFFQGGGKTTESMLVALAQRELQRRNVTVAKALSSEVVKKNPQNVQASSIKGYAELKEGDLKAAENTFYNLSRTQGDAEIAGKEGLSNVYAQKGEPQKAIDLARQVEDKDSERSYTHVVQGDVFYSQNKPAEAENEYRKAAQKAGGPPAHKAVAYNQLGRLYALRGEYQKSREMYERAVELDPFYVEATSNKGITYELQGQWDKALEAYRRAQTIDRNDPFALTLAAHAKKKMLLEKDPERREHFEKEAAAFVRRYKEDAGLSEGNAQDSWTSGPMRVALFEPVESGGLSKRDGYGRVMTLQFAEQLNASGRVKVVDPLMMERVVKDLGLSQKDLTRAETLHRLCKAFDSPLIGRGTLFHLTEGTMLQIKLEDIGNTQTVKTIEHQFASAATLKKDLHWLNREILTTIMAQYPLRAYVVEVTGNQILLNLGSAQGVVIGATFEIVEEKPQVEYKGKIFKPEPFVLATLEIVRVEPEFSYAHIKDQRRPIRVDDKLRERILTDSDEERKIW